MNAYSRTAIDMAAALLETPRAQAVYVSKSTFSGSPLGARHVVLVVPAGCDVGDYFECGNRGLALLRAGQTSEEIGLEALEPTDDEI